MQIPLEKKTADKFGKGYSFNDDGTPRCLMGHLRYHVTGGDYSLSFEKWYSYELLLSLVRQEGFNALSDFNDSGLTSEQEIADIWNEFVDLYQEKYHGA